jgi:hypothetical protein
MESVDRRVDKSGEKSEANHPYSRILIEFFPGVNAP